MPKKKNSGLGRGLDAIFLENTLEEQGGKIGDNSVSMLSLSLIDPKSDQPRKSFDREALESLASSISENGLLQPIIVREYLGGRYQIIAGERRFRASKIAGLAEIPVIIMDKDDRKAAEIALIENIQREDLNPAEEAMAYRSLMQEYGLTQEELSARIGKSRSAIANTVRLLDLPEQVLDMVASGEISAGHGRTLLGVNNVDNMILLANRTVEFDLSVRQLEEAVKLINKPIEIDESPAPDTEGVYVDYYREMELRIQSHLGRRAVINGKGRKKTLTLYYEDNEDLDELLKTICGEDFLEEFV